MHSWGELRPKAEWWPEIKNLGIYELELLALMLAARDSPNLDNTTTIFHVDNSAACFAAVKGRSTSAAGAAIVSAFHEICHERNILFLI